MMRVCQVALSSLDAEATRAWYVARFGFLPSGVLEPTADISPVQGVPNAAARVVWMVDQLQFFQWEIFQYTSPEVRRLPTDWRPSDIGYVRIGLFVADFDAVVKRISDLGTPLLGGPMGVAGDRRAAVSDPDGVVLELMERDPILAGAPPRERPEAPVATRSITLSVPDLACSQRFFVDTLGFEVVDPELLHRREHEALWGLEGADREVVLMTSGDFWVELVHYSDPPGASWPTDYRISDQGILNIAVGTQSADDWVSTRDRALAAGYRGLEPIDRELLHVQYFTDGQGFSVEFFHADQSLEARLGFQPVASI